jgi:hypothetical protein
MARRNSDVSLSWRQIHLNRDVLQRLHIQDRV